MTGPEYGDLALGPGQRFALQAQDGALIHDPSWLTPDEVLKTGHAYPELRGVAFPLGLVVVDADGQLVRTVYPARPAGPEDTAATNERETLAEAADRHGRPDGCRPGDGCPCYPDPGVPIGALPPFSVEYIDPALLGGKGIDRWFVMGTLDGDPRNQQGPIAICEYEPSAHTIAALLNAATQRPDDREATLRAAVERLVSTWGRIQATAPDREADPYRRGLWDATTSATDDLRAALAAAPGSGTPALFAIDARPILDDARNRADQAAADGSPS